MKGVLGRATYRRSVGVLLAVLTFSVLAAFSESARACSPPAHVGEYSLHDTSSDTTPPVLSAAKLSVRRAKDPDGQEAACENLGRYTITVEASDDETDAADLGFALALVDGSFPFHVPEGNVIGDDDEGKLSDWFVDDGEAFDGTIEVRVVDRAGNLSEPVLVSASGDEVGCSCSAAGAPSTAYGWWLPFAASMLLVRRRSRA